MVRRIALVVCLAGFALLAAACDPGEVFHFKNKTTEPLFVEVNHASGINRLSPGKSYDPGYLSEGPGGVGSGDKPLNIHVVDIHGCTVLNIDTTLARFKKEGHFSLVINQSDLPPTNQRTPCDPALADIATRTQD